MSSLQVSMPLTIECVQRQSRKPIGSVIEEGQSRMQLLRLRHSSPGVLKQVMASGEQVLASEASSPAYAQLTQSLFGSMSGIPGSLHGRSSQLPPGVPVLELMLP